MIMNKYTIICSEQQTKRALELGAPLFRLDGTGCSDYINMVIISDTEAYIIPTAEEMIGWLEEQRLFIHIDYDFKDKSNPYKCEMSLMNGLTRHCGWFVSRKEATLAAIDAALKYLMTKKGE